MIIKSSICLRVILYSSQTSFVGLHCDKNGSLHLFSFNWFCTAPGFYCATHSSKLHRNYIDVRSSGLFNNLSTFMGSNPKILKLKAETLTPLPHLLPTYSTNFKGIRWSEEPIFRWYTLNNGNSRVKPYFRLFISFGDYSPQLAQHLSKIS